MKIPIILAPKLIREEILFYLDEYNLDDIPNAFQFSQLVERICCEHNIPYPDKYFLTTKQ